MHQELSIMLVLMFHIHTMLSHFFMWIEVEDIKDMQTIREPIEFTFLMENLGKRR